MFRSFILMTVMAAILAGCSNPEKTGRYLIDPPDSGKRLANRLGTAELRDVSLPEYAAGQEVAWQTPDGAVRSVPDQLWADSPQRAFTLTLAGRISDISGATVIAEPWPLGAPPDRRLEVRVEKALAGADGMYRLEGRYFVSNSSYTSGNDLTRKFNIVVPLGAEGPGAIARAQSNAIGQLADQIARLAGPGNSIPSGNAQTDPLRTPAGDGLDPIL
ncbi:PqiC family protein [Paracoccus pacificus]|uniref:Membrane integrity-associated transporter subunit PqiC n=1 Tax=Paracoccus pacificus TaxID=1463598 RepID=A0ABW4R3C5_9RHOB